MLDLGSWSFGRVMLVSALWMGLVVFAAVAGIYLVLRGSWSSAGSGGIGAVSGGIGALAVFVTLLGPPIVLTLVWLYRRSGK
jgi:hypothetical protein